MIKALVEALGEFSKGFIALFPRFIDSFMTKSYPNTMASLDNEITPIPTPSVSLVQPVSAPQAPVVTIETFCTAIMNFEGGPSDPNHINNNPGDCRCSQVGYLSKYGAVNCTADDFAVFPTFELGWEYLEALVSQRVQLHPEWTIYQFFQNYAPSGDKNDPNHYAEVVAADCGVQPTITLLKMLG